MSRKQRTPAPIRGGSLPAEPARGELTDNPMNASEEAYARHLEAETQAGRVLMWAREPVTLRLAKGCRYLPDFMVVSADNRIEFHEVKAGGAAKVNSKWRHPHRDGIVKIKVAADKFPFRFILASPCKGGWTISIVGRSSFDSEPI
jgi:hypothetical protein